MYKGYFELGGAEIGNTMRAYGYSRSGSCPIHWLKTDHCETISDLTDARPYTLDSIYLAPWYDPDRADESSRFYGVSVIGIDGAEDSTRSAAVVERVDDGGKITGYRHSSREVRVRTFLSAKGQDALSYGMTWLRQTLEPGSCSMHGTACGLADFSYFIDCPPERGDHDTFSAWATVNTNLATNPSFETTGGAVEVRRNLIVDPAPGVGNGWGAGNFGTTGVGTGALVAGATPDGLGSGYVKTWTTASTNNTNASLDMGGSSGTLTNGTPLPASTAYSASLWFRAGVAGTYNFLAIERVDATTNASINTLESKALAAGQWYRFSGTRTSGATVTSVRLSINQVDASVSPIGTTWAAARAMVESVPIIGTYFDGATQVKLRRNLSTNPRLAADATTWGAGSLGATAARVAVSDLPDFAWAFGTASSNLPLSNQGRIFQSAFPVIIGTQYTLSAWVKSSGPGNFYARGDAAGGTGTIQGSVAVVGSSAWQRVSVTFTATEAFARPSLAVTPAGATGSVLMMTGVLLEAAPSMGTYFDGATVNGSIPGMNTAWDGTANASASYMYDADFTTAWAGTANASASLLNGTVVIDSVPGSFAYTSSVISSTQWDSTGTKSLRIIPKGPAAWDSFYQLGGYAATNFIPGKTYTVLAKMRLTGAQTGPLYGNARAIEALTNVAVIAVSNQAPNAAGETILRTTFTVPLGVTWAAVRIWNGAYMGGGDVWVDDLLIVEGAYDGDYFDGSTADPAPPAGIPEPIEQYVWSGTADASTSLDQTRTYVPVPYTDLEYRAQVEPYRRLLHGVACISGPMITQEFKSADESHVAYMVEFTLLAENPFIYTIPKPVPLGAPITGIIQDVPYNLVPYPSMELASGTVEVARNYSLNPSAETDVSSWATVADGTVITTAMTALTRSTTIASVGAASARTAFTATGASTGSPWFGVQQDVAIPDPLKRYSINMWGFAAINSGTAVMGTIAITAFWRAAGATLRTDVIGSMPASGGPLSLANILPPPTATSVIVRAQLNMTSYASGAVVYLYSDALAVTNP